MCILVTRDATRIYYKDWGTGRPVVFSHGWPLSADAWDAQMLFMGTHGYRVIAHDRRGHGRSEQTWAGNDIDTYAEDLAQLLEALDLRDVILVGHSLGAGEVVRYLARRGSERVTKLALVATITPHGATLERSDELRTELLRDRSALLREFARAYYSADAPAGLCDSFWRQGMLAGIKPVYDCVAAWSETDFRGDLEAVDIPTLIVHGDDDRIAPLDASARRSAQLVPNATLVIYPGGPHGLTQTHAARLNHDLLQFAQPR